MPKPTLTDITVKIHYMTEKAMLVSLDGNKAKAVWLPLSQIEYEEKGKGVLIVTLPIWLAEDKELI